MSIDVSSVFLGVWENLVVFFTTSFFILAIKFFLFVYVVVLFIDIVLLLILRGLSTDVKKMFFGSERPLITRSKIIKRWESILARLESDNPSQYKVAVLEADEFADEILLGIGYKGVTMAEKLQNIKGNQLQSKDILIETHAIRNRIIHETNFSLSREEAEKCVNSYKKFFDEVELL